MLFKAFFICVFMGGRRKRDVPSVVKYRLDVDPKDTFRVSLPKDRHRLLLPGLQECVLPASQLSLGAMVYDTALAGSAQYAVRLRREVEMDPRYRKMFGIVYAETLSGKNVPRFMISLLKSFGDCIGLFRRFPKNSIEQLVVEEGLVLSDSEKETLVNAAFSFMNHGVERVASKQTVEGWFNGTTTLALPSNMDWLKNCGGDLGRMCEEFCSSNGFLYGSYYSLREVEKEINRHVVGRETHKGETISSSGSSGNNASSGECARDIVRNVVKGFPPDSEVTTLGKIAEICVVPANKLPASYLEYDESCTGQSNIVSLHDVCADMLLLDEIVRECLHLYTSHLVKEKGDAFAGSLPNLYYGGILELIVRKKTHYLDILLKRCIDDLEKGAMLNSGSTMRDVFQNAAKNKMELYERVYSDIKDGSVDSFLRSHCRGIESGSVSSALETYLCVLRAMPRCYWEFKLVWYKGKLQNLPDTLVFERSAVHEKKLGKEYGIDVDTIPELVQTYMAVIDKDDYVVNHDFSANDIEPFWLVRRMALSEKRKNLFFKEGDVLRMLAKYGLSDLAGMISPLNYVELPSFQQEMFSTVHVRVCSPSKEVIFSRPEFFERGMPMCWLGIKSDRWPQYDIIAFPKGVNQPAKLVYADFSKVIEEYGFRPPAC